VGCAPGCSPITSGTSGAMALTGRGTTAMRQQELARDKHLVPFDRPDDVIRSSRGRGRRGPSVP
jgi:hypothetical protein